MSHTPHELADEFPEFLLEMTQLRQTDLHFAKITDDYHAVNRAIHRAETNIEPASDMHIIDLRKQRMRLKDEIYGYLARDLTI